MNKIRLRQGALLYDAVRSPIITDSIHRINTIPDVWRSCILAPGYDNVTDLHVCTRPGEECPTVRTQRFNEGDSVTIKVVREVMDRSGVNRLGVIAQ